MILRRVLIATGIYPPDIGGPATYAKALVEGLPHQGVEPSLLVFSPLLRYPRGLRHVLFLRQILTSGRGADVLMALDAVSVGLPALAAAWVLRKPLVLRLGGDFAWEQAVERFGVDQDLDGFLASRHGGRVRLLERAERFTARRAARVIVPDRTMRRVAEEWGVPGERIVEVGNVVDLPELPASREAARSALGVEGRLIVSMGRLLRLKGFDGLIEAVGALRPDFPDLRLAIVGSGPQHRWLAEQVREAGLGEAVMLLGSLPREKALSYVRAADLFALNSASEGESHSILEAMAVGTPVIATRAGGNVHLIEHGRNGWLVSPRDRAELVEAIGVLLRDPARASRLAQAARLPAERFDTSRMVRSTMAVLRSAA
jgi:glycosyltransferase involved in cell wall biosynthesis